MLEGLGSNLSGEFSAVLFVRGGAICRCTPQPCRATESLVKTVADLAAHSSLFPVLSDYLNSKYGNKGRSAQCPDGLYTVVFTDTGTSFSVTTQRLKTIRLIQIFERSVHGLSFPHVWDLFRFMLPKRTRERIYEPAYNDLLALYLEAQQSRYQTKWARRWLWFCFAFQSFWLVVKCYRALAIGSVIADSAGLCGHCSRGLIVVACGVAFASHVSTRNEATLPARFTANAACRALGFTFNVPLPCASLALLRNAPSP